MSNEETGAVFPVSTQNKNLNNVLFAKTLARALADKEVRRLLKQEALKMFDKDYDVLYGLSRNTTGTSGKSLNDRIAAYATSKEDFNNLIEQLPLLTIYIPQLDHFDADKWDIDKDVPIVAVRNVEDKKNGKALLAYDTTV